MLSRTIGGSGSSDLTGIEDVVGGRAGERVIGLDGNDTLNGHAGDDVADGGPGDDLLNLSTVVACTGSYGRPIHSNTAVAPPNGNGKFFAAGQQKSPHAETKYAGTLR